MKSLRIGFHIIVLLIVAIITGSWIQTEHPENQVANIKKQEKIIDPTTPNSEWVKKKLEGMTLEEKIAQFFMIRMLPKGSEQHFITLENIIKKHQIGGLIVFQGTEEQMRKGMNRLQRISKTPLLISIDGEWGLSMRLSDKERFPYAYTIGAANDEKLTQLLGEMMGQECREAGVNMNFTPVADVNSNPNNPVIGFRSFGEYPRDVAKHVAAMVTGMEKQGVMTSIKHFPGHGDTDVDSHKDLPVVNNTYSHINAIDFFPFRAGIRAGASTVMIAHLKVPALDPSGTPSSLSKKIIRGYLKENLGFKGIVVSDALEMKAIADRYGAVDAVVKAFEAGCDILLLPKNVGDAIQAIANKVRKGEIAEEEINKRCIKILNEKYKRIIRPMGFKKYTKGEILLAKRRLYEKAITVLKNEDSLLPIQRFDKKMIHISIGTSPKNLNSSMDWVSKIEHHHFKTGQEALTNMKEKLKKYDVIFTTFHTKRVSRRGNYGMPKGWREWLRSLPEDKGNIVTLFGNPYAFANTNFDHIKTVVIAYENNELSTERTGQFLMGTFASQGKLPVRIKNTFKLGTRIVVPSAGRLKMSQPEELGISPLMLQKIDSIALKGIHEEAYPGCQVQVAVDGKVIYQKSFGHHTYEKKTPVKNDDVYDIASITKIASSVLSLMCYDSKNEFSLDHTIGRYLPELTKNTPYYHLKLRHVLAHQAGLKSWIPFYKATLKDGQLNPEIYSKDSSAVYNTPVAKDLWIIGSYKDSIFQKILSTPLRRSKTYKYSDLGYYFIQQIIEKKSGQPLNTFVEEEFYRPMGLTNMHYLPKRYFPLSRVVPTENDTIFRKRLIHGYVHDQGAAMLGGVGGHAGLFSNANDLSKLMQMFLNNGTYGNVEYIAPEKVEEYTKCQFCPTNRRGAGFDKPTVNFKGGPTCNLVSLSSYGHSGFTGTIAWTDPDKKINYVFLSNRIHPNAENWKLIRMNIRTEIQKVIYEAVNNRKQSIVN